MRGGISNSDFAMEGGRFIQSAAEVMSSQTAVLRLYCVVVGVVTIYQWMISTDKDFPSRISIDASNEKG